MKRKKQNRGFRWGRLYDLLILPVYIVLSCITLYALKNYTDKYFYVATLVLGLTLIIYMLSLLYNKRFIEWGRRILLTLLCGTLLFGYGKINSVSTFFQEITKVEQDEYTTTQMNIYALNSNDVFTATITKYEDIDNKKIALNTSADKNASAFVKDKMDAQFSNIEYVEYNDYAKMMQDLYYGYIDAACINVTQLEALEATWGPLTDFSTSVRSFTYKEKIEINQNEKNVTKEPFSVLISANDEIGVPANNSLSDMNMLVMINPVSHQIITTSVPRDAFVGNPAYDYENDKLTHTGNDGAENTRAAVAEALGVDVDFYVKVSFSSVIKIIDELGTIDVDVPIAFTEQDENRSFDAGDLISLPVGAQKVNGKQALAFARHRHSYIDQDLGRNQAQMQVIKGIIARLMSADGIGKIDTILNIASKYVLTNFSNSQIQSFIKSQIDDVQPWSMSSLSLAGGLPDEAITASWPGQPLSIFYLKKQEVHAIQAANELFINGKELNTFHFSLDALYLDITDFKEGENSLYYDPTL